ncbi:MAG TPA: hypothetical protein VHA75_10795, partial [Rugosimonospora sp.]|nr:hypothetical protein [Rugosimonospora sp.]
MKKPPSRRGPRERPLPWWLLLTVVVFAVAAIGPPLWGDGVFAGTDLMFGTPHTAFLNDTVDAALPQADLFAFAARHGDWLSWNPYIAGGVPLGAIPNVGLASPLMLPYLFLPAWLAPAYVKLLEIACAVGGSYLYLRRINLGAAAALLGGLAFASSAFMIVWSNYPQTRTAAFIPALFWAVERLLQRRRAWDAAVIALVVAAMLFGGFPSVTGYALYTAVAYLVVRAVVAYRHEVRTLVGVTAGGFGGIAVGFALAAVQLVPFAAFMGGSFVADRQQRPHSTLLPTELLTAVAPWALGTSNPGRPPLFFMRDNLVEGMAYVGAAALVLAVFALTRPGRAHRLTPAGVLPVVIVLTVVWVELVFVGGWPLGGLEHLPVFSNNFIGRARSILGFLVAVLVAVGFELVLRRDPAPGRSSGRTAPWYRRWRPAGAGAIRLAVLGGLVAAVVAGRQLAKRTAPATSTGQRLGNLDRQVLIAAGLVLAATLLIVVARRGGPRLRAAAVALLPVLVLAQALSVTTPYFPRSDRQTYYPQPDVVPYLAANLGDERIADADALWEGSESAYRIRALDGHAYLNRALTELLAGVPDGTMPFSTVIGFKPTPGQATSPVLDRLGVRYFLTSPADWPFGVYQDFAPSTGFVNLAPGHTVRVPVPGSGPIRGLGVKVVGPVPGAGEVTVVLRVAAGDEVASGTRSFTPPAGGTPENGWPLPVPITGEDIPAGTAVTADITVTGTGLVVSAAAPGQPATADVRPADDRLRLVFAGSAVVYQRLDALPRIRWAGNDLVVTDQSQRITRLASGTVPADTVVLSAAPATPAQGQPADVT